MSRRTVVWSLALALVSPVVQPGLAAAQNAVLYEATETTKLKRKDSITSRVATAALMGWVATGTSICPDWLVAALGAKPCGITALASNNIDVATGKGTVKGKFSVVVQDDNPVDGREFVIAEGSLRGTMDLSPVLGRVPLGTISGGWSAQGTSGGPLDGLRMGGTFSGTFRLPFATPWGPAYLLNPSTFPGPDSFVLVAPEEHSLGVPTVRLELDFVDAPAVERDDD